MEQAKFQTFCDCFYEAFQNAVSLIPTLEISLNHQAEELSGKMLSAIVGVAGLNQGRVHLEMNQNFARKMYECANGEAVSDEMDLCFYLAEFANVVAGKGITMLNNRYKGINLRLTPPAIFAGDNLEITTPQVISDTKLFCFQYGVIKIEIGFEGM